MNPVFAYGISFASVIAVVAASSPITGAAINTPWYRAIRPSFTPPNFVFPIAWTTWYIMIAVAMAQALMLQNESLKVELVFGFVVNLVLNVVWCYVYFGFKDLAAALGVILILNLSNAQLFFTGYAVKQNSYIVILLVPYFCWILFATALNFASLLKADSAKHLIGVKETVATTYRQE